MVLKSIVVGIEAVLGINPEVHGLPERDRQDAASRWSKLLSAKSYMGGFPKNPKPYLFGGPCSKDHRSLGYVGSYYKIPKAIFYLLKGTIP